MSKPETITIDDVKYVRADSLPQPSIPVGPVQIVVLDKGFVYVGHVSTDDKNITIKNAKNIRVWGTTKGLGELVDGPTKSTKVDAVGTVVAPIHSLIHCIMVREGKWAL